MQGISLNKKINKSDLKTLGNYLKENDLLDLLQLHGFLTAIVSAPNMIPPSEWIDFLGLNDGEFDSMEQAQSILGTVMGIYNDICTQLMSGTLRIINIKSGATSKEKNAAKNLWAKGYLLGVGFDEDAWMINDKISTLLLPILAIRSTDEVLEELIGKNNAEFTPDQLRQYGNDKLVDAAISIHQYWLKRRNPEADFNRISSRKEKVGRNDPCICGSGKKYKKCCLVLH